VKLVGVAEAVAAIPDGATIAVDGFTLMGVAEALYEGIEESFRETGHPRDLTIVHAAGQSNRKIGFEHFAVEGLAKRIVGSHWGLMPRMSKFLGDGLAEAVCLPQGQIATLYRAITGRVPPPALDRKEQDELLPADALDQAGDEGELVVEGEVPDHRDRPRRLVRTLRAPGGDGLGDLGSCVTCCKQRGLELGVGGLLSWWRNESDGVLGGNV